MAADEHTWIAFLRAINLGAHRKFPKDAIRGAAEAAGGTGVETYINTGNVRLDHPVGSREEMERLLEAAFAADRGFDVPTVCFDTEELSAIAAEAARLGAGHDGTQYVWLLKDLPGPEARATVEDLTDGRVRVVGRAAHLLTPSGYQAAAAENKAVQRHLGVGTNRNVTVIRALAAKWC